MRPVWKIILMLSLLLNIAIVYVAIKAHEYRSHINEFRDKYLAVIDEFSGRDVYAEQNAALKSDTVVANRVVFLGTQVITNWDVKTAFPEYEAINRGVPYQRAAGFLLRFKPDVLDLQPRAVLIETSSYNLRPHMPSDDLKDFLITMVGLARCFHVEPILATMIPPRADSATVFEHEEYILPDSITAFNAWMRAYCDEHDVSYVDFNQVLADKNGFLPQELSLGAIDPNETGYERLTAAIKTALSKVL
ncbi:MAG: hypothetical protein JW763_08825 [candidate division Zixibacteria bacterium]|nr:hypothetical protein [candidate division Zixibacteria bacterium]